MKLHLLLLLSVFWLCQSSHHHSKNKPNVQLRRNHATEEFTDDVIIYDVGDRLNFICYGENIPSGSVWHLMQIKGTSRTSLRHRRQKKSNSLYLDSLSLNESDNGTKIYCRVSTTFLFIPYDSATSRRVRLVLKKSNPSNDNEAIENHSQTETSPVEKEANPSKQNGIEPAYFALGFSTTLVIIVIVYFFARRYQRPDQQRQHLLPLPNPLRVASYHQYETMNEHNYTELHQNRESNLNCKKSMECHPKNKNSKTSHENVNETIDVNIENSLYSNEQDINESQNTFYSNVNTGFINEELCHKDMGKNTYASENTMDPKTSTQYQNTKNIS